MDIEKQRRVIQYLMADWSKCKREQLVFEQFVQELKEEGRVGILEQLHRIRSSPRIQEAHAATYKSLDAIVSSALGEMPLDQAEKLIQHIKPDTGEPN
jgi:phage terminase small subunit